MTIAIEVLVYLAVGVALLSAWLMLRMRDPYQMLHFVGPPASVSAGLITIAIFLQRGFKPESFKALFATFVLGGINATVTHATARAFRIRASRDWMPKEGDEVSLLITDEKVNIQVQEKP